ncbi:chaplin [Kitasatospora sp. NPDC057965]|uniref:chaplin n=1 Tax=Kitasatospora sp. NPDC057965 TaxID=3346291 RepID=UPI0036DE6C28
MRNAAKKGLLTAVATGSVLASTAGYAYAGAGAEGVAAGSPGVASGNSVQVPIEVPINACGNTVDVIGLLNPSYGNKCANVSGHPGGSAHVGGAQSGGASAGGAHTGGGQSGGAGASAGGAQAGGAQAGGGQAGSGAAGAAAGTAASGATAAGTATGSPGVISGNSVQAPVHVPVNACGNSIDVVGALNPAYGNNCANVAAPAPSKPAAPQEDCPPEEHAPHSAPPPAAPSDHEGTQGTPRGGNGPTEAAPTAPSAAPAPQQAAPAVRPAAAHAGPAVAEADHQLAATGAGNTELLGAAGLALLIGGGVLYRRARAGAR